MEIPPSVFVKLESAKGTIKVRSLTKASIGKVKLNFCQYTTQSATEDFLILSIDELDQKYNSTNVVDLKYFKILPLPHTDKSTVYFDFSNSLKWDCEFRNDKKSFNTFNYRVFLDQHGTFAPISVSNPLLIEFSFA